MSSTQNSPSSETVAVQTLSTLAIVATLPPLFLHWTNRNLPAVCLICWYLLTNLFNVINAFIWSTDNIDGWWNGVGLCDIEIKLIVASYVGIPGTLTCIFRNLACVLDTRRATLVPDKKQRWRNRAVEFSYCVVIPAFAFGLHFLYQGNRYFIFAISGCVPGLDRSWVSLALGFLWPLLVCLIATYYCGLVLYRIHRYRNEFGDILQAANSGLSKSRFLRLFFISFIMLLIIIPTQILVFYVNLSTTLPWHSYSWDSLRQPTWHLIEMVPTNGKVYFDRWISIGASLIIFLFFGCGKDAWMMYHRCLRFLHLEHCLKGAQASSMRASLLPNTAGSTGSQSRLLFHKYRKRRSIGSNSASALSIPEGSKDLETGPSLPQMPDITRKRPWLINPFAQLSRSFTPSRERVLSVPRLGISSNTISTNAWAGSSQSRGSVDLLSPNGFIQVKQVIRQESEVQV